MNDPLVKVSIIMATYNSQEYVTETINSILAQTYFNWELLITDDCSSDQSFKIISEFAEQYPNIHVFKNNENSGAAVSRNNSIKNAKGQFVAFLDSDDLWLPEKLEKHLSFMEQNGSAISFTSYGVVDEQSNATGQQVDVDIKSEISYRDLLSKKATFGCSTVIVDTEKTGSFSMPLLRTGQDFATWLLLLKRGNVAHHFAQVLTCYRITPGSISRNKVKKAKRQWQIYREIEKLGLLESIKHFVNYAYRAVFRR